MTSTKTIPRPENRWRHDPGRPLLAIDEPPPYAVINPDGASPYLLLCEHAANRIPRALGDLGLPEAERRRHIAWDIGVSALSQHLSRTLDAPLFMTNYSRLVIDCNRPLGVPSAIPEISETTEIPGNLDLTEAERQQRIDTLFTPTPQPSRDASIACRRRASAPSSSAFIPSRRSISASSAPGTPASSMARPPVSARR